MYTTYYPNLQPYIKERRVNGKREDIVYIYDVTGKKINDLRYYNKGQIWYIAYWQNGLQHNIHGPAWIGWHDSGQIYYISCWQNGLLHNLHGPAWIGWHDSGQINLIEYYQNGKKISDTF